MGRPLVFLLLVGLLGWIIFQLLQPEPEKLATPAPQSTEQQLRQLLTTPTVDAATLATLCEKNPQLANQILKDAPLRLTGTINDFFLSGLGGRRAGVVLQRGSQYELSVIYDLDRYSTIDNERNRQDHFYILGNQLLLLDHHPYRESSNSGQRAYSSKVLRQILHTRADSFRANVTFAGITQRAILLHAIPR